MAYTNSPLVVHTRLSPNNSGKRTHSIDRITPHCVVGQCTAEGLGEWFSERATQASSNYGIDKNGRVGRELTKAEYLRLLEASKKNEQLNLVIQTICSTGIRVSELRFFTVEAIRCGEVIVDCKNKTRTILVPVKLRKRLLNYAKRMKITTGTIFVTKNGKPLNRSNIWSAMKRLCESAGVKPSKVFPHNLRKLFARTFYGIEKDIAKLADILGHSSINTTRI